MAFCTTTSLHLPSFRSSKTLSPLSITKSFHLFPSSINLFSSTHSIPIPSSPKLAVSSNFKLDHHFHLLTAGEEEQEQSFLPQPKLFVGNLPFNVDDAALARLFQTSGSVELAEVVYDKLSRRSRGFGFVTMSSVLEAEAAVKKLDGYEVDGRQLRVNYGPPPRREPLMRVGAENSNTVYVGNLSWRVDSEALETLFWEHGNVMKAKVLFDKESGRSRGFGFVTYSCADEVSSAVESLDGVDLDGRNIRVSVAVPPQRRQL